MAATPETPPALRTMDAAPTRRDGRPDTRVSGAQGATGGMPRGQMVLVLAGILLGILMGALDNLIVATVLPKIAVDLLQANGVPFVIAAYLIAATVATPIFGKLADLLSKRDIFVAGMVIFIAGSILAGLSQSLTQLIAFRAVQGFGSGAFFSVGFTIIAVLFSPETRARLTGAFSSIFGIATVAGPFVGSYIVDHTTWRWIFYINIPIGVVGIALLLLSLGPLKSASRARFDYPGAGLLASWVTLLLLPLVLNSEGTWSSTDPRFLGLLAGAAIALAAWIYWEAVVAKEPLVPLRFFAKRVIAASSSIALLRGAVLISVTTFISVFIAFALGGSPDTIRDVLYGFVVPMVVASAVGGTLLTRTTYRILGVVGMGVMFLGTVLLLGISTSTPTWVFSYGFLPTGGLLFDLIPLGAGVGLTFASTALSVQYAVAPKDLGAATSLVQFLANLGGAVGVSVLTAYQQLRLGVLDPVPAGVSCPVPPVAPINLACVGFYSALPHATGASIGAAFALLIGVALAALVSALFLQGRLPKTRPGAGTGPGGS
ncbi:MAG: MFS transporter [Thermoplasmata archaeon]|nr:MFS transporter [Thermoplasmata archaeon]